MAVFLSPGSENEIRDDDDASTMMALFVFDAGLVTLLGGGAGFVVVVFLFLTRGLTGGGGDSDAPRFLVSVLRGAGVPDEVGTDVAANERSNSRRSRTCEA